MWNRNLQGASCQVKQILPVLCKPVTLVLDWKYVKGIRVTKIVKQIKFQVFQKHVLYLSSTALNITFGVVENIGKWLSSKTNFISYLQTCYSNVRLKVC